MRFETCSFRFAEEVLNSKLGLKNEICDVLHSLNPDLHTLSRPCFNRPFRQEFVQRRWRDQPLVFEEPGDPTAKMDFMKERIGVEVGFGHTSFLGIDLLKF